MSMEFCEAVEYLASKIASEENRGSVMHRAAIAVIEKASEGTYHGEKAACDEALQTLKESA